MQNMQWDYRWWDGTRFYKGTRYANQQQARDAGIHKRRIKAKNRAARKRNKYSRRH